ncbi:MAG TPA: KorC repressor protein [Pseudomonas xinjiangensis]|uniref:KorC repressor protein n=2 Tax=root TaxID=1 RepID=A0A7V1FTN6_9GAMM|nr:KorC repressor protein [Halopseudomonas xinjiangensis]HEC46546.1 KorC repressor protein [Halopseudomonas xinjiangensis]
MEIPPPYTPKQAYVPTVSLLPYDGGWQAPDREAVRAVLTKAKLDPRLASDFLGVSRKEVNRWTTGEGDVPFACWALLCWRAGVGFTEVWW